MTEEQKPFVPAEARLPELTVKAVGLGIVLAAMMGAANAYLALKAGQTVSATFPAAILALAAFRLPFFRGNVLEQNIARSAGTVGEALAAGAIFTIPAFLLVSVDGQRLWTSFHYGQTALILLIGGIIGVLFITLLRRTLVVDADLPYPESKACAAIVKAGPGQRDRRQIRVRRDGRRHPDPAVQGQRRPEAVPRVGRGVPRAAGVGDPALRFVAGGAGRRCKHGGAVAFATPAISPALIGVGYIIGFELAAINFSGGVLAWLVFIPLAFFVNPGLADQLHAAGDGARRPPAR